MNFEFIKENLNHDTFQELFAPLYGEVPAKRLELLLQTFSDTFGLQREVRIFSAPGRVELCGNHTDHQGGCVVALAVDLDVLGVVRKREDAVISIHSIGLEPCTVDLSGQAPQKGTSQAIIYGVAKALEEKGYTVGGFDCVTHSSVPVGSGLSSSAAFENFVATVLSCLYNNDSILPVEKALAGQKAENEYFGKPCGLMDQMASCLGNVSFIDFKDTKNPVYQTVSMPLEEYGYTMCVVKTGGSHADLTHLYAAIPAEMKAVASCFGKEVLSQITKADVAARLSYLREKVGDRAVLRSLNYFDETARARQICEYLQQGKVGEVLYLVEQSGMGSQCWLQNVSNTADTTFDGVGMALYCSKTICPDGVFRVHGGGFGGTMLGFVPTDCFAEYKERMESIFGVDSCVALRPRTFGGIEVKGEENH